MHCNAIKFEHECPTFCCRNGRISLAVNDTPQELIELFTNADECSANFRKYARVYNKFFAFTSLGGKFKQQTANGIYTLLIHGQLYHFIPDLLPNSDNPNYLQMYFYDGAAEFDTRIHHFNNLRPDIISTFMSLMNLNPYAHFFRSLRETGITERSQIIIPHNPVLDQRVYNAPTSNEVDAIFIEETNSTQIHSPHIIVYGKSKEPHRVMHYFGCYDLLQYPLLFPKGESGWHQGIKITVSHTNEDIAFPRSTSLTQNAADLLLR